MKCIQEALRNRLEEFLFEGKEIKILPTTGIFITMNPGYAGRAELPDNLKPLPTGDDDCPRLAADLRDYALLRGFNTAKCSPRR